MKKIFCLFLTLLISAAVFAEDYAIKKFTWDKNYSDVISFFVNIEWSMRVDKQTQFVYFTPVKDNFFYQNKLLKIKEMFFSFDSAGNMTSQNITLDNGYSLPTAYMACISTSIVDNATFYDQTYENSEGIDNLYYYLHLADCNALYAIVGKDTYYMLFLSYTKE